MGTSLARLQFAICLLVLTGSCRDQKSDAEIEQRLSALEAKMDRQLPDVLSHKATLNPLETHYSMIFTSFGPSAVTIFRPRDFAGGSEFEIGIANPSLMKIGRVSFNIIVLGRAPSDTHNLKYAWESDPIVITSRRINMINDMEPGEWGVQKVVIPEPKLEEIGSIIVEDIDHETIALRN